MKELCITMFGLLGGLFDKPIVKKGDSKSALSNGVGGGGENLPVGRKKVQSITVPGYGSVRVKFGMAGGIDGNSAYGQMKLYRRKTDKIIMDTGNISPNSDGRTYTYTYDIDDVQVGDEVEIWTNVESSFRNVLFFSNFNVWYDVVE